MTIYVLEGPDGVGKTYFAETLSRELDLPLFSFPGKHTMGSLGERVYQMHHDKTLDVHPLSMQIMHIAAHIDLLYNHIIPMHETGKNIIMDRCWLSTAIYGVQYVDNVYSANLELALYAEKLIWDKLDYKIILLDTEEPFKQVNEDFKSLRIMYLKFASLEEGVLTLMNNGTRSPIDYVKGIISDE